MPSIAGIPKLPSAETKAIAAPAHSAVRHSGSTMSINTRHSDAPFSRAASICSFGRH